MDPEIIIRSATPSDYKELAQLYLALMLDQRKYDPLLQMNPRFDAEKLVRIMLLNGKHKFFVAEHQGKIVGFYQVYILEGGQQVQLEPSRLEEGWRRFTPLRIFRKLLQVLLNWLEPKIMVSSPYLDLKAGYMANSYVLPEYQGRGIYREFAERVLDWFKQHQINLVYATAFQENQQVLNFWQKRGFKVMNVSFRKQI